MLTLGIKNISKDIITDTNYKDQLLQFFGKITT